MGLKFTECFIFAAGMYFFFRIWVFESWLGG